MLPFEQRVHEEMCEIIKKEFTIPNDPENLANRMQKAADSWRLPFWDWARRRPDWEIKDFQKLRGPNVPYLITLRKVDVLIVTGDVVRIKNPMFQFSLSDNPGERNFGQYGVEYKPGTINTRNNKPFDKPWIPVCEVTSRWPNLPDELNGTPDWEEKVTVEQKASYARGLEQDWRKIRDNLGEGYKEKDPDPRDRDPALFNGLPEAVLRLFSAKDGKPAMIFEQFFSTTFPVEKDEKNAKVKKVKKVKASEFLSLKSMHNNMHGWCGGAGYMGDPATSAWDPIFCAASQAHFPEVVLRTIEETPTIELSAMSDTGDSTWTNSDYIFNVVYKRFELDGSSFSVTIFLGDVPTDNVSSYADKTATGEVYNFNSPMESKGTDKSGCASCAANQANGALVSGQVIITNALIKMVINGELPDLEKDTISRYLKDNIHWRIRTPSSTVIPSSQLPSLQVFVAWATATNYAQKGRHTDYGPYQKLDTRPSEAALARDAQTGVLGPSNTNEIIRLVDAI